MFTLPRHCERSEAIQLTMDGLPRRLRLLAMTMMGFVFLSPNAAFACMESVTYKTLIGRSEIIFEGHLINYEKQDKFSAILTFEVDKNWKGTKKGQLIKLTRPAMFSLRESDVSAEYEKKPKRIVLLTSRLDKPSSGIVYQGGACPDGVVNSPADEKEVEEMLQQQWKYWPFWAFYSVMRGLGNLV